MQFGDFTQPFAFDVLGDILARSNVGESFHEPLATENLTSRRLQNSLRSFEHQHVIRLTAWLIDARDHRNEKHLADASRRSPFHCRNSWISPTSSSVSGRATKSGSVLNRGRTRTG